MTPEEAAAAIAAGLGPRLMADWLEPCGELGNDERVYLLCPASIGREGGDAPEFSLYDMLTMVGSGGLKKGRCNFLRDQRCELHETPHKPKQCRECFGCQSVGPDNYDMGRLWNNDEAQALVRRWRASCG